MTTLAHAREIALPLNEADPIVLPIPEDAQLVSTPSDLLRVYVGQMDGCCEGRMPIAGRYNIVGGLVAFVPAFGFDVGQDYVAQFRQEGDLQQVPFRVGAETAPCAGTRQALHISFDRPFDRHLLPRDVRVTDGAGVLINGNLVVGAAEQSVVFTPKTPWPHDGVRLLVNPTLEDVAANNFQDLLDHVGGHGTDTTQTMIPITLKVACN